MALLATLALFSAVESAQAQCSSWDADASSSCNGSYCGQRLDNYNGQPGWTQGWVHDYSYLYCESWSPDDWRIYFYDSWVADPANRSTIRVRYQGSASGCEHSTYAADYLLNQYGAPYLRITVSSGLFGQCDDDDYVIVAP